MSRLLQSGGDIFIKREQKKQHVGQSVPTKRKSSGMFWKTSGVTLSMLLLVFGINAAVTAGQTVLKPQTANTITDTTTPPQTPGIMQFLPRTQQETTPVNTVTLAQNDNAVANHETTPPPPFTFNQPIQQPIQQPITNPTLDLGGIVNQINQANASIVSTMQACVQITQQAQVQITQLRTTEQQMQTAINDISRQNLNLNPNDPNTPAYRAQLLAQRDQLIFQRNQVISAISQTKSQFSRSKADCQNSVYRQQNAKRNLENQLQNAFQRAINVNLY